LIAEGQLLPNIQDTRNMFEANIRASKVLTEAPKIWNGIVGNSSPNKQYESNV
jgi:hypothetical protein